MTAKSSSNWIVLTDFDGTLTERDVGNDLCRHFLPDLFDRVISQYEQGNMNLRAEQAILWQDFPANKATFAQKALELAKIRRGVNEFLEFCSENTIPVYIASCGMDAYIEAVIEEHLSPKARKSIVEIRSNQVKFSDKKIIELITPDKDPKSAVPFHKGNWGAELRKTHPDAKILGIGDGSSDFSMVEHVDLIYATRKLAAKCEELGKEYKPFEDFFSIMADPIFQ